MKIRTYHYHNRIIAGFIFCSVLLCLLHTGARAEILLHQNKTPDSAYVIDNRGSAKSQEAFDEDFVSSLKKGRAGDTPLYSPKSMLSFYSERDWTPLWVMSRGRHTRGARILADFLETSWTHGLNPENYHITRIRELMSTRSEKNSAELELLLSDALVRYAHDMTGMRVSPSSIDQVSGYWRKPLKPGYVLSLVADSKNIKATLEGLAPNDEFYESLRKELVSLTLKKQKNTKKGKKEGQIKKIRLENTLYPGDSSTQIPLIRSRLGIVFDGELGAENTYDDKLAIKIMDFQEKNGLKPDAIIGAETVNALNMTDQGKIDKIIANLERIRWLERKRPSRYVLVNIPSATLWALEDGKIKLKMPVIVGSRKRPSNSFKALITGVRFNPDWTVPPTIKLKDFLPKLRQNPYHYSNKGFKFYQWNGQKRVAVDPGSIDWHNMGKGDLGRISIVQKPGSSNPLGRVRLIMNNPYNIYLHDTNKPHYFEKEDRLLSSGCIRVSKPVELAAFVLGDNSPSAINNINKIIETGKKTEVQTSSPVEVYILYQTIWKNESGRLVYGKDVYGRDAKLISALKMSGYIHNSKLTDNSLLKKGKKTIAQSRTNG